MPNKANKLRADTNGFCSIGFALPGAIAAQLVHPKRRVVAMYGDGGFLMKVQEIETARSPKVTHNCCNLV